MVEELLSIGDFSRLCGLSAKVLRSYAAAGLLVPAAVDGSSGYRYYSAAQLPPARVIALLRQAGIPLREIAAFFDDPSPARLDRWECDIVRQLKIRRDALAQARAALDLDQTQPPSLPPRPAMKGSPMPDNTLLAGAATHVGGRDANQDAWLVRDGLYALADGLGGLQDGEVASRLALETLEAALDSDHSTTGLVQACKAANRAVWQQATLNSKEPTMGTTLAALAITSDGQAIVAHIGDSRLYQLSGGHLSQLTSDHSVVAELLRDGKITTEEAKAHPHRHVLTRALGVGPDVDVDTAEVPCQPGDQLVLCTDGLFKTLTPEALLAILTTETQPQRAATRLVVTAVEHEAEDNVTAIVIRVG